MLRSLEHAVDSFFGKGVSNDAEEESLMPSIRELTNESDTQFHLSDDKKDGWV
jgi:hypothetical protein